MPLLFFLDCAGSALSSTAFAAARAGDGVALNDEGLPQYSTLLDLRHRSGDRSPAPR
jgi:hypothetical protein